ncbi:hypothetical protein QE152_g34334 [Popillia japonica]|uniref:Reverse transcriptase n=1 Tax=Popillia japonica TaxID=7064 RepID=A0AAW1ITB7_POPJA
MEQVREFWKNIYETIDTIDLSSRTLCGFKKFVRNPKNKFNLQPSCPDITTEEVQMCIAKTSNFSAPGPDGIQNIWWKQLTATHGHLARIFNNYLKQNAAVPIAFVEGRTILILKDGDSRLPKNYRPITCLNTGYKLYTSILNERLLLHI